MRTEPKARPVIFDYRAITAYLNDMNAWCRKTERNYSTRRETRPLRRCSPALVTRVLRGERRLTLERVDDFAKIFRLNAEEKSFLGRWIELDEKPGKKTIAVETRPTRSRQSGQNHLLKDWLNVYVKDACRLRGFNPDPQVLHRLLHQIASPKRIERSLRFLLREGFLRRTLDGKFVENESVITTSDEDIITQHIQRYHLNALDLAKRGIKLFPIDRRQSNALVLRLNADNAKKLKARLRDFYETLLVFAEENISDDEVLYQITIHMTPVGGQSHGQNDT